jgi:glyoxylase-like metal-dependent hydrolase (beta-lactamase superfamily II)
MTERTLRWQVGRTRITSVVEAQTDGIPPVFFFPAATEDGIRRHDWLVPRFADAEGRLSMRVQAFVVEPGDAGDRVVVVDPCIGNGKPRELPFWNDQHWPFIERFTEAGFEPADVDQVVHTHLHVDHVGWDTHLEDGRWVPTFTRARHLYVPAELDWFRQDTEGDAPRINEDSVAPIFDAGLADIVAPDADLGDGLHLEPTVGHTPGHTSLWVESEGEVAVITGDAIHHPVQCAEPTLGFVADHTPEAARTTRADLLGRAADRGALVLGTHFATAPGGRVVPDGDVWRFEPVEA